ncbi:hypothetical protein C7450_101310 [Chelatococcus asaccharovorans]|uniref:Uncharacterized protein n=1 Tax=Chelatococcus asaccharovorans TaxID=28210 RepID=A0A2V3UGS1_9HYPH|nr:hypothetical protein C7450_101310 [Chelatococcus asaccharovorans]
MRLRPEPPRVTRLSRKVLIALGVLAGTGIGGTLIYALQTRHGGKTTEELYSTDNRTTPDGLAGLPKDYAGIPKLGPPRPRRRPQRRQLSESQSGLDCPVDPKTANQEGRE